MALPAMHSLCFQQAIAQVCRRRPDAAVDTGMGTRLAVPKTLPISEKHFRSELKSRRLHASMRASNRIAKRPKAARHEV